MAKREERFRNISEKVAERGKGLTVMKLGNDKFAVSSSSKPNTGHLVETLEGYSCDCTGFNFHGDCAHIVAVETFVASRNND